MALDAVAMETLAEGDSTVDEAAAAQPPEAAVVIEATGELLAVSALDFRLERWKSFEK